MTSNLKPTQFSDDPTLVKRHSTFPNFDVHFRRPLLLVELLVKDTRGARRCRHTGWPRSGMLNVDKGLSPGQIDRWGVDDLLHRADASEQIVRPDRRVGPVATLAVVSLLERSQMARDRLGAFRWRRRGIREGIICATNPYNETLLAYNDRMTSASEHIMTVSRNGQVSIPAGARARWNTRQVIVVDLGDRVVMRPAPEQPIDELEGKYHGRGPSADNARRQARQVEASGER